MKVAQELYEGIDVEGMGAVGLITYMRTDSLRISDEARAAAQNYIETVYGKAYIPPIPRSYKSKNNSQDAHEAIRPSLPDLAPVKIKDSLSADQFKLYRLIWERFIASQMASQLLATVAAVSYTHLVVYKRQDLGEDRAEDRAASRSGNSGFYRL